MNDVIYLSMRNLLTLISKLDGKKAGQITACTLVKSDDTHPTYAQTMSSISVVAKEDGAEGIDFATNLTVCIYRSEIDHLIAALKAGYTVKLLPFVSKSDGESKIYAINDSDYYTNRLAGSVHPLNDPAIRR
jgi:hypothetical protein